MSDQEEHSLAVKPKLPIRRYGIYAAVLLFVFLLGFIPMWVTSRDLAKRLFQTEHQLTNQKMQNSLATAVIMSRRGDYEPARLSASQFFTSLRAEADKGAESSLTAAQRDAVQPLFTGRDEIITLLARNDPAASDKLSDLYVALRKLMNS